MSDFAATLAHALDPYAFAEHWDDGPYVARRWRALHDAARFLSAAHLAGLSLIENTFVRE